MEKPVIGITMGDATGIGPEIIVKALTDPSVYQICDPLVIGDGKILNRARQITKGGIIIQTFPSVEKASFEPGHVACLDLDLLSETLPFGEVSGVAGHAAYRFIEKAVELCIEGKLDAICTAPLNKEALQQGGHNFPGHTEILATLTGAKQYAMMFSSPQ
jgi:4-phospho-D-threonate 3-dehydrogenase / 4-phospho-D-erythronate 3-dehydrogenase